MDDNPARKKLPHMRNAVERISVALDTINERLNRITERLDGIAEAYRNGHAEEFEWQNYRRMAGHPGYTDNAHNFNVIVSAYDIKGQPITRRAAIVQTRSGVSFNFTANPIPTNLIGSIEVHIND